MCWEGSIKGFRLKAEKISCQWEVLTFHGHGGNLLNHPGWRSSKTRRFSHLRGKCGPACRLRDGLDDLFEPCRSQDSLILLVNLEVENSSCVLDVTLEMLNLSQSGNQWNISRSVRQEPWGPLWAWNSGVMAYSKSDMQLWGPSDLLEIIVSALEPEILTFRWQFAICCAGSFINLGGIDILHNVLAWETSWCLHDNFLSGSQFVYSVYYFFDICGLHLFGFSCKWPAWVFLNSRKFWTAFML